MQQNVGGYDRIARFVLGPALVLVAAVGYLGVVTIATGLLGAAVLWAALVVGLVFVVTAAIGYCPLNRVLGINTYPGDRPSDTGSERDERGPELGAERPS